MPNPFLDGTFPEQTVVLTNEHCVFVQTPQAVLVGSGLIVTKAARETVFDLTPKEWAATYDLLQRVKAYLDETLLPDGSNIGWDAFPVGGQAIPHVHLHVNSALPRRAVRGQGDSLSSQAARQQAALTA